MLTVNSFAQMLAIDWFRMFFGNNKTQSMDECKNHVMLIKMSHCIQVSHCSLFDPTLFRFLLQPTMSNSKAQIIEKTRWQHPVYKISTYKRICICMYLKSAECSTPWRLAAR